MVICGNIGVVARDRMVNLVRKVATEIPRFNNFKFTYFEGKFAHSFEVINKVVDDIDLFLCGHGHSRLIEEWFPNKPVVVIDPLPFDILSAILEAAKIDHIVNIINTYEFIELEDVKEILRSDINISQYRFKDDSELKELLEFIRRKGGKAVVGGTSVNELAPAYGLKPFYYYSEKAVKDAIVDATNLVLLKFEQKLRQENINKLIDLSNVGLMVVDENQKFNISIIGLKMLNRTSANTVGIDIKDFTRYRTQ